MDEETAKEVPAKKERPVFEGFNPSFKGYSQLPNEWLDEVTSQIDSMAELKVVLYIYRHTWGFQKKSDNPDEPAKHDRMKKITTDEFMHGRKDNDGMRMDRGTGLSDWSVKDGVARALKHGYIICDVDAKDKARVKKSYGLKFRHEDISLDGREPPTNSQESDGREPLSDGREPTSQTRKPPTNKEGNSQRTEKDTSARNKGKERMKESASIHSSSHSLNLSFDCLNKIRDFSEMYKDENVSQHQEEAQRIYQQYTISDDDFYGYLIEAYAASSKTKLMSNFFEKLQKMLDDNFKKRLFN